MSTAELWMTPEDIEEFISGTLEDYFLLYWGEEDGPEYGVSPYITFYIYHSNDEFLDVANEIIEFYQELQKLFDRPILKVYNNEKDEWSKATSAKMGRKMLREHAKLCYKTEPHDMPDGSVFDANKYYVIEATSEEDHWSTARWAFSARVEGGPYYTTVKITFRDGWYRDNNQQVWHDFILKWLPRLKPEQCYSGYEVGTTVGYIGTYESDVMERICADHFYGTDVDHPSRMKYHDIEREDDYVHDYTLGGGIRTPTWCFLLSPLWQSKLGKSVKEIKEALAHPDIVISEIPYPKSKQNPNGEPALWIRLGELDLYPIDKGVPELPALANALIKPIRCDFLQLYTLDVWADDPNPRFDEWNGPKWMARFDPDSDWPNYEPPEPSDIVGYGYPENEPITDDWEAKFDAVFDRHIEEMRASFDQLNNLDPEKDRCEGGQPCPHDGLWQDFYNRERQEYFKKGDIMPDYAFMGNKTIWHRVKDKE